MDINIPKITDKEISTFKESMNVFDISDEDMSRTSHRLKMFSYSKYASLPVLYRHYNHYHDDIVSISGYNTPPRDYCTLFIFVDGKIGLFVSDKLYTSGFGKIVTLNPGNDHTLFIYALENVEYYEFDFPVEYINMTPENSPVHKLFSDQQISGNTLEAKNAEALFHILNKIDKTVDNDSDYKDFIAYSLLMQAASLICDCVPNKSHSDAKLTPMLKKALEYISDNLTTLTDIKQVADYCNVSISYLCRMFKRNLDTSPLEYINNQKILRAQYLLKNGCNVTEACFESGFDNYNYFITRFKKTVGMTPTEYQKSE